MKLQQYEPNSVSHTGDGSADVIVVGGGLAGLAAASYVARAGRTVTLFDKSGSLGGRAESQERAGFIVNLGAHALYEKSAAIQVLKELGVKYTGGSPTGVRVMSRGHSYLAP